MTKCREINITVLKIVIQFQPFFPRGPKKL